MWLLVLVLGPVNIAVLGRTMGTYLLAPVDGACYGSLVTLMAMWMARECDFVFSPYLEIICHYRSIRQAAVGERVA